MHTDVPRWLSGLVRHAGWSLLFVLGGCVEPDRRTGAPGLRVGEVLGTSAEVGGFARADAQRRFEFPVDHGPHPAFKSEWWYLTLALADSDGREFGVQFTIFRQAQFPGGPAQDPWRNGQAYLGHFAVTDVEAGLHREAERLTRGHPALAGARAGISTPISIFQPSASNAPEGTPTLPAPEGTPTLPEGTPTSISHASEGTPTFGIGGDIAGDTHRPEGTPTSISQGTPTFATGGDTHLATGRHTHLGIGGDTHRPAGTPTLGNVGDTHRGDIAGDTHLATGSATGGDTHLICSSPETLAGTPTSNVQARRPDATDMGELETCKVDGGESGVLVWLEGWRLAGDGDHWKLDAAANGFSVSMRLVATKPPILQGDRGLSAKGPGQASYYYSLPRLRASGGLQIGGDSHVVAGTGWLDREWSTSVLGEHQLGWDWFAVMLDSGEDIMAFRLRRDDGARDPYDHGVLVDVSGDAQYLASRDFSLEPLGYWRDERGTAWPVRWSLRVADRWWQIVTPVKDQRMDTLLTYWEGLVHVLDEQDAKVGRGYMELTGYR